MVEVELDMVGFDVLFILCCNGCEEVLLLLVLVKDMMLLMLVMINWFDWLEICGFIVCRIDFEDWCGL